MFLRYTGARPGEMAALTWDACDFDHGVIVLRAAQDEPERSGLPDPR